MINPFKATKSTVSSMFQAARSSDCAAPLATAGAVIVTPIVVPIIFIAALFTNKGK